MEREPGTLGEPSGWDASLTRSEREREGSLSWVEACGLPCSLRNLVKAVGSPMAPRKWPASVSNTLRYWQGAAHRRAGSGFQSRAGVNSPPAAGGLQGAPSW